MRKLRCGAALGTVLWLCGCLTIASLAKEPADEKSQGAGSAGIWRMSAHGQVVDPAGRPQAGARVILRSSIERMNAVEDIRLFDLPDILAETRSDEGGRFAFVDMALGPEARQMAVSLEQSHRGAEVVAIADGFGIGWTPIPALTTSGEVKIALKPAGAVAGIVQDDAGFPLAGAIVEAIAVSPLDLDENPRLANRYNKMSLTLSVICPRAVSDEQGRFRIEGLPADHLISLWARHRDHPQKFFQAVCSSPTAAQPRAVPSGDQANRTPVQINPVTLSLANSGPRLIVQVRNSDGKPPHGGNLLLLGRQTADRWATPLPPDGELQSAMMRAQQSYRVIYAAPEAQGGLRISRDMILAKDAIAEPQKLRIDLPPTRDLAGRVIGAATDQGLAGVMVIWTNGADGRSEQFVSSHTITDAEGSFHLPVAAGQGKLKLLGESAGFFIDNRRAERRAEMGQYSHAVDIPKTGPIEPLAIEVSRGLVIRGTVTDSAGSPVREIIVAASRDIPIASPAAKVLTASDGHFEIVGLDPREPYWLSAVGDGVAGFASIAAEPNHSALQPRDAKVQIILKPTVKLVGRILFDGQPQARVRLTLSRHDELGSRELQVIATDADGRYRLSGLQPGDQYSIQVEPPFPALDASWRHQWPHLPKLSDTPQDEVTLPDMNLRPLTQSLAGIVVDPDGKPLAGVRVTAMLRRTLQFINYASPAQGGQAFAETDASGRFELAHLPDEPLSLMAHIYTGKPFRHPAQVDVEMNQRDIRIVLDPSLEEEE